jgi:hypothetical protein
MGKRLLQFGLAISGALFILHPAFGAVTVLTVPWVPSTPLSPHTTYPVNSTTEVTVVLGATVPSAVGSGDSFTVNWHFGDNSPDVNFALTNPYDISTTHQYPANATNGTAWTAVVTVTDTTNNTTGTANYYLIQSQNNLAARVNVAIDKGLWYMHQTMWRQTVSGVNEGGWDLLTYNCNTVGGTYYDCTGNAVINAENVQAFEVSGHLANGPSTDPYTDYGADVSVPDHHDQYRRDLRIQPGDGELPVQHLDRWRDRQPDVYFYCFGGFDDLPLLSDEPGEQPGVL